MKRKANGKRNSGFTLVEMLAVTAIVVILLAVGMVALVHYVRWLEITELDNSAREIYLAAENRAVLLMNSGKLKAMTLSEEGGDSVRLKPLGAASGAAGGGAEAAKTYYIYYDAKAPGDSAGALAELLPEGAIDPALRKGAFYIVYEIAGGESTNGAGSVTDVFYAEDTSAGALGDPDDFSKFYYEGREASRETRIKDKRMFGYYGGEAADSGKSEALSAPRIEVINGEELLVRLSYDTDRNETGITPKVYLIYEGRTVELKIDDSKTYEVSAPSSKGKVTHVYTWVLDTLDPKGKQFADWFPVGNRPGSFGGEFTVEARLEGETVKSPKAVSEPANSLFANESKGTTACVGNLRHLQNLDAKFSGVGGKTAAVQIANIDQSTSELDAYQNYEFVPIVNEKLNSYSGSQEGTGGAEPTVYFIKGLKVTESSATVQGKAGNTETRNGGLFSEVSGGTDTWRFKDVRLINTEIAAPGGKPAGALVGSAQNASFEGCWVYWDEDNPEKLVEKLTGDKGVVYQIKGSTAGGLAGELSGTSAIKKCLSATLIRGGSVTGGLVGQTSGSVNVENSYADCYLTGHNVAGLIGNVGGSATLTNVYTAGFIDGVDAEGSAAGLCGGTGVAVQNAYSAMQYENMPEGATVQHLPDGAGPNCYYLASNSNNDGGKTFQEMSVAGFVNTMNNGTSGGAFARKSLGDSHPYNLREGVELTLYPFPGLEGLPHYGDWNTKFVKAALVYYEEYAKNDGASEYGFAGGGADSIRNYADLEKDGRFVPLDGYAVAFRNKKHGADTDGVTLKDSFMIEFTCQTQNGNGTVTEKTESVEYQKKDLLPVWESKGTAGEEKGDPDYYLAPLPRELVESEYASKDFYQLLGFEMIENGAVSKNDITWSAYCPHFAKTARPMPDGVDQKQFMEDMAAAAARLQISVRTPRHLRWLSKSEAYYKAAPGRAYIFNQELDLDYKTYRGYDWESSWDGGVYTQSPIGSYAAPFNGTYDGSCYTIQNVRFKPKAGESRYYAGLFGYSAKTLRNVVYLMDAQTPLTIAQAKGAYLYLGTLAGGNSGEISNCAVAGVNLQGKVFESAFVYAGGLVGENSGIISNCAAESALLSTGNSVFSYSYVGGLVGRNQTGGAIQYSYAVGKLTADVDRTSNARLCGFVGYNYGVITNCYAAVNLESSGEDVTTYGFCGDARGSQEHNCFLNEENFEYRDGAYNASYETPKAASMKYRNLTDVTEANDRLDELKKLLGGGMKLGGKALSDANLDEDGTTRKETFPFPTGVKKGGEYVHYGQWPEELNLGEMGVYYWEKLEIAGKDPAYYVSLLSVDPAVGEDAGGTAAKRSTLSNARSDGGVVTDYGYGYYHDAGLEETEGKAPVKVATSGILYTGNGGVGKALDEKTDSLEDVDEALHGLMEGYRFHSFRSFVPNPDPGEVGNFEGSKAGLYSEGTNGSPNGTITLTEGEDDNEVKVTFEINPHFADALAVAKLPEGYKVKQKEGDDKFDVSPGTKGENPYEVRAMGQLSAINWNSTDRGTKTVLNSQNCNQFPYLSHGGSRVKRYWRQTRDVYGHGGTYTPIAEYYDQTNGDSNLGELYGWFGGVYNGDYYEIRDVKIQGQTSSCAGLFGIVYTGELDSIIMYSSDGTGTINSAHAPATRSCWYAIGCLAGMAATDEGIGSAVKNCAAAGYTINANVYVSRGWGGSCIGGLVGISNMKLEGCAAETAINIPGTAQDNDNMRVGGLVGTCQKSIENCYAGGSITLAEMGIKVKYNRGIYVGGIVGGSYFKPLAVSGNANNVIGQVEYGSTEHTNNELKNCYSYVILPAYEKIALTPVDADGVAILVNQDTTNVKDGKKRLGALYAIGGTGEIYPKDGNGVTYPGAANHGTCTMTNCYYLESEVLKNNRDGIPGDLHGQGPNGLKTDIASLDNSNCRAEVWKNGTQETVELEPNDVRDGFTISAGSNKTYSRLWTRSKGYYGHKDDKLTSNNLPVVGTPIFQADLKNSSIQTGDQQKVTFAGWFLKEENNTFVCSTTPPASDPPFYPMALTYRELSGVGEIKKSKEGTDTWEDIYAALNQSGVKFQRVTTTEEGFSIPGKYSYGTKDKLRGLDYPFPTILTREGGQINVHYGNWPLLGIEREKGGEPITLNLFSAEPKEDKLTLSEHVAHGGTWMIETPPSNAEAYFVDGNGNPVTGIQDTNGKCTLHVAAKETGLEKIWVKYTEPGPGGESYTLGISVHVSATLRVRAEEPVVCLFPGESRRVPLILCDDEGLELKPEVLEKLAINTGACGYVSNNLLASVSLEEVTADEAAAGQEAGYYLDLTGAAERKDGESQTALLGINVVYTYGEKSETGDLVEYSDISSLQICMVEPEVTEIEPEEPEQPGEGEEAQPGMRITFNRPEGIEVSVTGIVTPKPGEGGTVKVTDNHDVVLVTGCAPGSKVTVEMTVTLTQKVAVKGADGQDTTKSVTSNHEVTVVVEMPPEPEPEEPDPPEGGGGPEQTEEPGGEAKTGAAPAEAPEAEPEAQAGKPLPEPEPRQGQESGKMDGTGPVPEEKRRDGEDGDGA